MKGRGGIRGVGGRCWQCLVAQRPGVACVFKKYLTNYGRSVCMLFTTVITCLKADTLCSIGGNSSL